MPRILSLDKMLDDLRGAAAADNAATGFQQGLQQGHQTAALQQEAKAAEAKSFDQAHPGVATSYLTDQGRKNYDKNDAARKGNEAGAAAGAAAHESQAKHHAMPPDYDKQAQAYFQTLSDMNKSDGPAPPTGVTRPGEDVAQLDAAYRSQGGVPTLPGAMPGPTGNAPPPPGGYGGPPSPPMVPGGGGGMAGLSEEELAALDAAARNPNAGVAP